MSLSLCINNLLYYGNKIKIVHDCCISFWNFCGPEKGRFVDAVLWELMLEAPTVSFRFQSITKFGAFSMSESIVDRYVTLNIWMCVSWRSGACSVRTSLMQQSSSGVFDSEPVWKLTVGTSSTNSHSTASTKRPFTGPQKFQKEIQLSCTILILFP